MNKLTQIITSDIKKSTVALIIFAILALGFGMRLQMVTQTEVDTPIRMDAADYYLYAHNLLRHGVYSRQTPATNISIWDKPVPDAFRNPGYPLFLIPFVEFPPTPAMIRLLGVAQAVISTFTILLAFCFLRAFLSRTWALAASIMVAISPHLIVFDIYMLTESLFTFFMVLVAYLMRRLVTNKTEGWAVITGIGLGCTLLIRPTLMYFIFFLIPAFFIFFKRTQALRLLSFLVIGFSITYGPWIVRNLVTLDAVSDSSLAVFTVQVGMYPGAMYRNIPESCGAPQKFDPDFDSNRSMSAVLKIILKRFENEPVRYIKWYFIGKPLTFFSWKTMLLGNNDIFVYPVLTSPYDQDKMFRFTYHVMQAFHWPMIICALFASILVWFPSAHKVFSDEAIIISRFCSLLLMYFVLVHIAVTPTPRYSVPLRPFIYGMGMLGLSISMTTMRRLFSGNSLSKES
jgi:4-amino-4-deoxy-L-arabinose transferase-like glycosyltransferase